MKIAIADSCIFIELYELKLTQQLFSLPLEVHTSLDVFNELYPVQKELLSVYQSVSKLIIHTISGEDREKIFELKFPKSLSASDKTVLYLALKLSTMILSSDRQVRNNAKDRSIEYHGMLWIFDTLLAADLITHEEATEKLKFLITKNIIYQNSPELLGEMDKRIKIWSRLN